MDFHTHNLDAPAAEAIINIPREWFLDTTRFRPRPGALYSAGLHPWWTADEAGIPTLLAALEDILSHPQVVAVGECGIDRLRGAAPDVQEEVFKRQLSLAEASQKPVTIHCVRAFDVILRLHSRLRPTVRWTIHGFRGRPALARQLLAAGLDLSFGPRRNEESYLLTPPERRHEETDDFF